MCFYDLRVWFCVLHYLCFVLRLAVLGRTAYISAQAKETFMAEIAEYGLPDAFSRRTLNRARDEVAKTLTTYGPLVENVDLETIKDGPTVISMQNPLAAFEDACTQLEGFADIVRGAMSRCSCSAASPWRFAIYSDEIGPGSSLKDDRRKSLAVYWSILEFGMRQLQHEAAWLTACVVRSTIVSKLPGGVAQLYGVVLKKLFGLSNPHNMASAGMCVTLKGGDGVPVQIFFDMDMNAADEPALKFVLHCKRTRWSQAMHCMRKYLHVRQELGRSRS